ncbi:uncharacterized protein [Montipora foliosa]|uniref:uncharacterized protein n=1 Tax=Montipora foliosa TaxID=591990 RepID=UPI0035F19AE7
MRSTFPSFLMIVVFMSSATAAWGQICGKASDANSLGPNVDLFVTDLDQAHHSQNPMPFRKEVLVQKDSNISLTCTASEPANSFPLRYYGTYLQPYLINWFVNSSLFEVSNCDETTAKIKTCTLSLINIRPRDQGKYLCQAVSQVGCTYDELYITVASRQRSLKKDGMQSRQGNVMTKFKVSN